jgi:hypothetical protein
LRLILQTRLIHLLLRVLIGAGVGLVALAATPASADPLPGYCLGANRPVAGSISMCTP